MPKLPTDTVPNAVGLPSAVPMLEFRPSRKVRVVVLPLPDANTLSPVLHAS